MNKKQLETIWAKAECEVWKERIRDGECSLGEFMNALGGKDENN